LDSILSNIYESIAVSRISLSPSWNSINVYRFCPWSRRSIVPKSRAAPRIWCTTKLCPRFELSTVPEQYQLYKTFDTNKWHQVMIRLSRKFYVQLF